VKPFDPSAALRAGFFRSGQVWRVETIQLLVGSIENEVSDLYNTNISGAEYFMFTQRPGAKYE